MDAATNQAVCGIFLPPWVELKFAFNYLFSLRREFIEQGKGGAQPNISQDIVRSTPFPLPPLPEQRRIVAKLEELFSRLDAGVAAVRQTQALLKRYRQSVLHAAVTGELTRAWREAHPAPAETGAALLARIRAERRAQWEAAQLAKRGGQLPLNDSWKKKYEEPAAPDTSELPELPAGWVWASMRQLGEVRLGRQRAPQHHSGPYMRPYLRVANVYEDRFDLRDVMEMNFTPEEYEVYSLRENDILLNEGQSLELVGRPALYRNEVPGACFTNTLVRFRTYQNVLPKYALSVFRSYMHNGVFQKIASWTTSIAHLGADRFAGLHFPLPPLAEQAEIVAEVERRLTVLDALGQTLVDELKRAERLRQSLLHRAFTGRLVPQDATDEPAAALLDRLREESAKVPAKGKAGRGRKSKAAEEQLSIEL
ncbi:hypothetical protein GCM10023185_24830 [Hymenobacter saemangeumensis]|uniref:Type I restriction modification DNA specificity domain-containing protein n=1 Tax=Hymenobacter saemangeumensis TaxID=1084522 RepID=A0ABP8IHB2_9BACT